MDISLESCQRARRELKIADHIVHTTFPVVKDNKLLLGAIENVFLAASYSMSALLHSERDFKRIPPFEPGFLPRLQIIESKCKQRYSIDEKFISFLKEIKDLVGEVKRHQKNSGTIVMICKSRVVTINDLKAHIGIAKEFTKKIEEILAQNGPYARI
jgi:hypothetical protein